MKYKKLKQKSLNTLKSHYFLITITCLLSAFIGIEFIGSMAFLNKHSITINPGTKGVLANLINMYTSKTLFNFAFRTIYSITSSHKITNIIITILGFLISLLFYVLIKNVYKVISKRILLESRIYEKVPINRFTYLIKIKRWFKTAYTMFIYNLYYFLWCFTIVGIFIKRYEYFLVPFIISENPNIPSKDVIKLSKNMMYNHKWECFLLELSFIGYDILGTITLGITEILFSNQYKSLTYIEYYAEIRKEYIKNKKENYQYLFDEYLYEKASSELLKETYKDIYNIKSEIKDIKLTGFKGFMYNNFGINLYDEKTSKEYEQNMINKYRIKDYEHIIEGKSYPVRLYKIKEKRGLKQIDSLNYMRSYRIENIILLFFIFSFIGYSWEVLLHIIEDGRFVNRGVLHGPWLPIYGSGGMLILILLKKYRDKPALELTLIMFLCGLVEYLTSVYLEIKYSLSWWNYNGYFLNLHGRICAEGLIVFALGGMIGVYIISPLLDNLLKKIPKKIVYILCIILTSLFIFDKIYSAYVPNTGEGISGNKIERRN